MSKIINVLVCEGRKLIREGVSALLSRHADVSVVGEADDIRAATKLIEPLRVQVVVLILPQRTILPEAQLAIQMVRELHRAAPDVKAVLLTMGLATAAVRQLISAGAAACLTKECASQELIAAIRTVVGGKVYLSPRLTEQVVRRYVQAPSTRNAQALSPRETEVLRRIARGQSTKEIAYAMRVGSKTIETHRRRIMEKLNRHSVAELTQYAMVRGLIELPESIEA